MTPRLLRDALVALVALAIGLGGAVLVLGDRGDARAAADGPDLSSVEAATPVTAAPTGDVPPGRPASDPTTAIEAFLDAEIARDHDASFVLLSPADRAAVKSAARWRARHDSLPTVAGFTLGEVAEQGDRAVVPAAMRYEPALDPFVGVIPQRADSLWSLVREGDGWTIDFERTTIAPRYPTEARIPADVERWVERRVACEAGGDAEYAGGLLGSPTLADVLCDDDAAIRLSPVGPFASERSAGPFLSEFGDEVLEWARVVELHGPSPMRIVVAPLGERWLVIGVLPSPTR